MLLATTEDNWGLGLDTEIPTSRKEMREMGTRTSRAWMERTKINSVRLA
jgi:hypothetical protein